MPASMPMVPPAPPVRFSTRNCWPSWRETFSPTSRAMKSSPPPAARCTMKRTGWFGQSCARAMCGANSAALASAVCVKLRRVMVIKVPRYCSCSPDEAKRNPGTLACVGPGFRYAPSGLRHLRFIPIQYPRPVPRGHPRPAQHRLEGAAHVADPVRHPGEIGMHCDRHDLRSLHVFRIEALEVIHHARVHLSRRMVPERHQHDVVQLEII